jgi:hypothetical protein
MRKQRAERLRFAVNSLPPETQRAMLDGINENRIVTGANTDRRGGKCPMIAADPHAFEVTPLAEIFATAWDKYTGTSFVNVTRRTACERDLSVLRSMLETSLALHPSTASHAVVEVREVAELPVAPRAEFTDASRALTVSARLEVIRALAATEHTAMPQARTLPAPQPATAWVDEPQPARRTVAAPRRKAARVAPAVARTAAPAGRTPTYKTKDELDRQRAREIIANQASTLRSRAWPRAHDAQPVAAATPPAAAVPTPAAVTPAPVAAPTPTPAQVDRVQELVAKSGFAWLRPLRSYDEYEQTLTDLGETHRARAGDDGGVHRDDTKRPEPSRA